MKKYSQKLLALSAAAALAAIPSFADARVYNTPPNGAPAYGQPVDRAGSYVADPSIPVWAGAYGGLNAGFANGSFRRSSAFAGPEGGSSSGTFGGQVGYNWQRNRIVYGLEADVNTLDLTSRNGATAFNESWFGTVRGRVGYAMGPWLPYATGGLALTKTRAEVGTDSHETVRPSYTLGGGVERFFAPQWSAKAEYLYVDVPKDSDTVGATVVDSGSSNHVMRVGVNYHF
jgi:outer membrane immunogenic protein